jgi:hypothetical protein
MYRGHSSQIAFRPVIYRLNISRSVSYQLFALLSGFRTDDTRPISVGRQMYLWFQRVPHREHSLSC